MQAQADTAQNAPAPAPAPAPAATPAPAPATPAATEAPSPAAPAIEAPEAPATPAAPAADTPVSLPAPADVEKAVETAVESIKPTSPAETAPAEAAAEKASGVSSNWVFLLGLGLLALFVVYFAAEKARMKRIIGTVLSIAVAALCILLYEKLGMEKGIELQGGISMEIKIQPKEGQEVSPSAQQQAIGVLTKRLNDLGTADVLIAPSGTDGIFLQMPGIGQEKLEEVQDTLEKVAELTFSILHPQSQFLAMQVANGAEVVPGYEALAYAEEKDKEGNVLPTRYGLVKIKRDMEGANVASAGYFYGDKGDSISVSFTGDGSKIMGPLTMENQGQPLAIILDNVILSSPVIQEPFSDGCSITGSFTQAEALALASALENPLGNPIEIEYSNYISPTMGEASVKQGVLSGIWGLGIVLFFLMLYYRFAGLVAMIGLASCLAIIFGTMALFQFTLTLPGIAGIILSIGMAVDANVLIYERLREETAAGKSIKTAIEAAYERALSAILDSNITSLLTAIILYYIADGTVKGFAVTLVIGIFATLFSALIVTRVCFAWVMDAKFFTKLTFLDFIPKKTFDFLAMGRRSLIFSAVLMLVSLIVVPAMDPRGVDLKGGDALTIRTEDAAVTKDRIIESIKKLDLGANPIVQEQRPVGEEGEFFLVRSPEDTAERILETLEADLGISIDDATVSSVGSAVGESMLWTSVLALVLGMLAILAYVTIRYEFAFALGTIAALVHDVVVAFGIATLLGQELNLITVGALLTIAGYSVNDTIVIFDRVREGLQTKRGEVKDIMNYALNVTLGRTILTSTTTIFTVVVLLLFGGPALRGFSVFLLIGMISGIYSTLYIAAPITLWWAKKTGTNLRRAVLDTEQSKIEGVTPSQA